MTDPQLTPCCQVKVADSRYAAHASSDLGAGIYVFKGRCPACDASLIRRIGSKIPDVWHPNHPTREELLSLATPDEIRQAESHYQKLQILGRHWEEFVAKRQEGDEFWNFVLDGYPAFALVRQGRPIAQLIIGDRIPVSPPAPVPRKPVRPRRIPSNKVRKEKDLN